MITIGNRTFVPLDGSVEVNYTAGGQVAVDDVVIPGRWSCEAGVKECNPLGLCLCIEK